MKKLIYHFIVFLLLFCGMASVTKAQQSGKPAQNNKPNGEPINIYYEEEENWKDITWKRNGFEVYIGGGAYFANKKTATYYNGIPENEFNLNLIFDNKYRTEEILLIMRRAYPYIDTIVLQQNFNKKPVYNIAMDMALGVKYRFHRNWYVELSYSFRRLTSQNYFFFDFPGTPNSNIYLQVSNRESLLAKEDRHYIDLSVGYIFQSSPIVKPFFSVGALFTYTDIKNFGVFIEDQRYNLLNIAKYPDYTPGIQSMPNYRVWTGVGYGCSLTAGVKIACGRMVSLDPLFQLSVASFGNSKNLPGFYTKMCFNYMVGVRLVMNDALFTLKKDRN